MGSLFRSEEMTLCQLFLQAESSYACISELGELGLVQFRDLNPDVNVFQRKFVNEVRRCDEMERKLRFLEKEIKKDGIPMLDTGDNPDAPQPREMVDLEATFEKLESEMRAVNTNSEALKRNFLELTELKHILRKTQAFFDEAEHHHIQTVHEPKARDDTFGLLEDLSSHAGSALKLGFVAGVILPERISAFERMLWRVCRGNVFLKQTEIETPLEDPVSGDNVKKSVFIIFFQGEQLKTRVKKICEGFRATLYPCPETQSERREMAIGVMTRIEDLNTVLGQTHDHRHRLLVAAAKNIMVWFIKVYKIKAIYHTLNMLNLDVTQKCLIAECWCPVADLDRIQQALRRGTERCGSSVPSILHCMATRHEPPTYHRVNKFTAVFQNIVNAYGVATYREVNPAPWTIISFPFLFAIMFGDAGHGLIMLLFAAFLVVREKHLATKISDSEIFGMFFDGRYIILLMGMFSIYTGLIYNDIFSKSVNIFGSSWYANTDLYSYRKMDGNMYQLNPNHSCFSPRGPYPFGLDPVWQMSINKIQVTNSFKMKVSVIFGVAHMIFGLSLSVLNHRYFKKPINIFCEFIPQMIFICAIFGYLILIIFVKWLKFTEADSQRAPNLLIGLINMFLMTYPTTGSPSNTTWYYGQKHFQIFLVILAVLCIPWMLLLKPYLLWRKHKLGAAGAQYVLLSGNIEDNLNTQEVVHHVDSENPYVIDDDIDVEEKLSVNSGDVLVYSDREGLQQFDADDDDVIGPAFHEKFDLSETIINQAIHTIEYCLGCISHTASYLRLWALSLAHGQLSEVLWSMVMRLGFGFEFGWISRVLGSILLIKCFAFWATLTVIILVLMEGLSAFLHALRLHWVEFQSKFYKGEGHLFVPFSFDNFMEYSIDEQVRH